MATSSPSPSNQLPVLSNSPVTMAKSPTMWAKRFPIAIMGPLSVEWEDSGMEREFGAKEALAFVRKVDFAPSNVAFDAALKK